MAPDPLVSPAAPGQLTTRTVYQNNWMRVREDTYAQQNGTVVTYGVVDKSDFAVVIAEEDGAFHLVEQFRYALGRRLWEFPMGTWSAGQSGSVEELARRELLEETGLTAATWRQVSGRLHQASGFCSQGFTVFHATDLTAGPHAREDTEADMVHALVGEAEFRAMIADGRIVDAPTVTAYALLRMGLPVRA